ncbi:Tetratricopeptide repeat domain protein [Stigmatella aurantiaca DW4/3-1]|uniref:Tetratricopeptide repeat domain protein n=1 Tax=Stigmatella aurantiaca (strain DW4/3-1) TaxID=378806 RepID=Q09AS0_STIAD|nr:Tetratricopeptide repeat domain protein [Stigmatella aurantiaca DW4/3-1]EAU68834.1 tetratricopeptide repeat domain protein [Stigmatella aurantiaca DW4/3-1]
MLLLGLLPLAARAAAPTEQAKAEARVKFAEGNAFYEQGNYRQALTSFDAAYRLVPLPAFLFNVAQCHRQLGSYERAASFYRRYLSLSEKEPPNAPMVKELITEMDTRAQAASKPKPERPKPVAVRESDARAVPKREVSLKEAERQAVASRTSDTPSVSPAALGQTQAVKEVRKPLTHKWWVWAGAGAALLLTGGIVYAVTAPDPRPTSLGTVSSR